MGACSASVPTAGRWGRSAALIGSSIRPGFRADAKSGLLVLKSRDDRMRRNIRAGDAVVGADFRLGLLPQLGVAADAGSPSSYTRSVAAWPCRSISSRRAVLQLRARTNALELIPVLAEANSRGNCQDRAKSQFDMANKRRFAMAAAVGLRGDYDAAALRVAAKRSKDGPQARRLLALAAIYDGASRTEAAKIGGVTLQVVRDWVVRFNAQGPDGLIDRKAPGQQPRLNEAHRAALAAIIESGPILRFMGSCAGGSSICGNGFSRNSASSSPSRHSAACCARWAIASFRLARHYAQAEGAIEDFKKAFPRAWKRSGARRASSPPPSRSGSPTRRASARRTRSRGDGPSAARAPAPRAISEPLRPISLARSAPRRAKARRSSCRVATPRR